VEVARQVGAQAGEYSPVAGGIVEGMGLLLQRETLCLSVTPRHGEIRWILLFAPFGMDTNIPMWHGMLELRSESHEPFFSAIKKQIPDYIAVAKNEPLNLTASTLTPKQFPWASRSFVAAALLDKDGKYIEHSPS
jgi:hypothetical protein